MIQLTKEISPKQFEWRNNPLITSWTRQNGLISQADQERWIKRISEDQSIEMFGIVNGAKENVGTCGLTSINPIHRTAEFSLLIGPEYQKRGYGEHALKALLDYGFKKRNLHCIWGETFEGNPALKLFLKLGMRIEGAPRERYFKNGRYVGTTIVSMLESEWR